MAKRSIRFRGYWQSFPGIDPTHLESVGLASGVTHKFLSPSIPMLSGMIENNLFSKLTRQALCIYA